MTSFRFTLADYNIIVGLVYQASGIVLNDNKRDMVYARLVRRIRQLKLDSFAAYIRYLESHFAQEQAIFINAITTNLTAFFREPHHFHFIRQYLAPALLNSNKVSKRVRLWSAGCATGEEAFSLAFAIQGIFPSDWDVRILATDIDSQVLEQAKQGTYNIASLSNFNLAQRQKWFDVIEPNDTFIVKPALAKQVYFKQLNLLHDWPMHGPFDLILCRNVMIYFDKSTRDHLLKRYANILSDQGCLFLGHSEMVGQQHLEFSSLGHTMYQKKLKYNAFIE